MINFPVTYGPAFGTNGSDLTFSWGELATGGDVVVFADDEKVVQVHIPQQHYLAGDPDYHAQIRGIVYGALAAHYAQLTVGELGAATRSA